MVRNAGKGREYNNTENNFDRMPPVHSPKRWQIQQTLMRVRASIHFKTDGDVQCITCMRRPFGVCGDFDRAAHFRRFLFCCI